MVHDEFSYLLGGETFAAGRLTNPTHPMSQYFETFHVLQKPSYNSKYPPGNALFIASGIVLTGRPIVGVWISFAFMCGCLYWMLRAWIGDRFAFGVAIAFSSWAAASYWSYSYWGGAVAAGAGALVLGALERIVERRGGAIDAAILAVGLVLLASSRPFEGMIFSMPAAVVFIRWLFHGRVTTLKWKSVHVMIPLLVISAIGVGLSLIYFSAVTGSWRTTPYMTYEMERAIASHGPIPQASGHETLWWLKGFESTGLHSFHDLIGRLDYFRFVSSEFFALVIPIPVVLPLLLLPLAARERRARFALITVVWTVLGMTLAPWFLAHYAAPMVGCVLIVYGTCLLWMSRLTVANVAVGKKLVAATLGLWASVGLYNTTLAYVSRRQGSTYSSLLWSRQRQLIADTLTRGGRRALVVVKYGPKHWMNSEWVYNSADIDSSAIVWAHDKGDPGNAPLLSYFRNRDVWTVEVTGDDGPYRVSRYQPSGR